MADLIVASLNAELADSRLFAFVRASNLFGFGLMLHKDLKAEFKLRKKARKAA
jgi:hypothetical protein